MPTELEVYRDLTEIFADVFVRDDIVLSPALTAKDVRGWDSFKQIEIIMACEEK
jgi:acyl carrier protein